MHFRSKEGIRRQKKGGALEKGQDEIKREESACFNAWSQGSVFASSIEKPGTDLTRKRKQKRRGGKGRRNRRGKQTSDPRTFLLMERGNRHGQQSSKDPLPGGKGIMEGGRP